MRKISQILERQTFPESNCKAFAFLYGRCRLCRTCVVLQQKGGKVAACRHPDLARQVMEAVGIGVFATARAAGLPIEVVRSSEDPVNYYTLAEVE